MTFFVLSFNKSFTVKIFLFFIHKQYASLEGIFQKLSLSFNWLLLSSRFSGTLHKIYFMHACYPSTMECLEIMLEDTLCKDLIYGSMGWGQLHLNRQPVFGFVTLSLKKKKRKYRYLSKSNFKSL